MTRSAVCPRRPESRQTSEIYARFLRTPCDGLDRHAVGEEGESAGPIGSIEPDTFSRFPSYASLLPKRGKPEGESRYSWTVDFSARRAKARDEMPPSLDEAAEIKAKVVELKEQLKRLKKEMADKESIAELAARIKERDKSARDLEANAADIDAAVVALKTVNPNTVAKVDTRTPQAITADIAEQGEIVSEALARLSGLLATADD
jgi:type I restriction enzyme M protein